MSSNSPKSERENPVIKVEIEAVVDGNIAVRITRRFWPPRQPSRLTNENSFRARAPADKARAP